MTPTKPQPEPELTCGQCQQWLMDKIGDGTGIGVCVLNFNPRQLKWPGITACSHYRGRVKQILEAIKLFFILFFLIAGVLMLIILMELKP